MAKKNLAEIFVDTPLAAGANGVHGVAGGLSQWNHGSIRTHESIRWIHVQHQETAAFAAGTEAHLTGSPVCRELWPREAAFN